MSDQDIRFRVLMDDAGMAPAAKRAEENLQGMGKAATGATSAAKAFGNQGKLTAQQLSALSQQTSDIAVTLAGGVNPLMVAMQQLPQLSNQLGGMGNVLRAYLSLLTPLNVGLGGLALVTGGAVIAMGQGYLQADRLTKSLALTGNAAGITRGQIEALASTMATRTNSAIGEMREAMHAAAGAGVFMGQNVGLAAAAAAQLGKLSGESAATIVKDFARMGSGVTQYAVEANRKYNFLTVEIYRQIKALEQQGKTQEAQRVLLDELANTMETRAKPAIGNLEKAWNALKGTASEAWQAMMGWGAPEAVEKQLADVRKKIADAERYLAARAANGERSSLPAGYLDGLRQREAALQQEVSSGLRKAEADAQRAADARAAIEKDFSGKYKSELDARAALEQARVERGLALTELNADRALEHLERQYERMEITAEQYEARRIAAARSVADAEVAASQRAVQAAAGRQADSEAERLQRATAVEQARTALLRKQGERDRLEAEIAAGRFNARPRDVQESALALAGQRARESAAQGYRDLLQMNREYSLALLTDDRARGQAQIAEEARFIAERIGLQQAMAAEQALRDLLAAGISGGTYELDEYDKERGLISVRRVAMSAEEQEQITAQLRLATQDRQAIEEAFAQWRLMRETQLNEQLKPEWQRRLDLWSDTTRDMADRYNEFMDGFVASGRESFGQWLADGKITADSLTSYIRAQFAKMAYERFLSSYVASAGKFIFDTFFGTGGTTGGGSGMPDDVPTRGGKAFGGHVPPYSAWTVGERGPEKLIMGATGGVIVPNGGMQAQQQPLQIVQHFHTTGGEPQGKLLELAAMARDAAVSAVADHMARGTAAFRR